MCSNIADFHACSTSHSCSSQHWMLIMSSAQQTAYTLQAVCMSQTAAKQSYIVACRVPACDAGSSAYDDGSLVQVLVMSLLCYRPLLGSDTAAAHELCDHMTTLSCSACGSLVPIWICLQQEPHAQLQLQQQVPVCMVSGDLVRYLLNQCGGTRYDNDFGDVLSVCPLQ